MLGLRADVDGPVYNDDTLWEARPGPVLCDLPPPGLWETVV